MLALLAFAGCQNKTATYKLSKDGSNLLENAQAFVEKVTKDSGDYSAEDWNAVMEEFSKMCQDYKANQWRFFDKDKEAFTAVRVQFIHAVDAAENPELQARTKQIYSEVMNQQ